MGGQSQSNLCIFSASHGAVEIKPGVSLMNNYFIKHVRSMALNVALRHRKISRREKMWNMAVHNDALLPCLLSDHQCVESFS